MCIRDSHYKIVAASWQAKNNAASWQAKNNAARTLVMPVIKENTLTDAGDVTNARVVEGGDECMRSSALGSARRSRFNSDDSAPDVYKRQG